MATMNPTNNTPPAVNYRGPHPGALAIIYTVLFNTGLFPVTMLVGKPSWPGPGEPASVIVPYFQTHASAVLTCLFLQCGAAVVLGIFTASMVNRMQFLGVRAAATWIALLGGFLTTFNGMASAFTTWTMIHPAVAQSPSVLIALYYLAYAFGGPGFSMPMGLLIAGIAVPAAFLKLLPKWLIVFGLVLAAAGELSWLHLVIPKALFLIPLVRFPGFVWLIAAGFLLRKRVAYRRLQPKEVAA